MTIDQGRVADIAQRFASLDPLEAYYSMFALQRAATSAVDMDSTAVLEAAMRVSPRVLDLGCGDGWRLLECRHLFDHATGIDESAHAIGLARDRANAIDARNVDFRIGDAAHLSFRAGQFDFVYSERGPLGYHDAGLTEALRVLKPRGRIFFETLGSLNLLEAREVFEGYDASNETLLTSLDGERRRSESLGVQISLLAALRRKIKFKDLYQWLGWQCSIWRYLRMDNRWPVDPEAVAEFAQRHQSPDGTVELTYHPIWVGGTKAA